MARRTRQLSLKECYEILQLQKGADLQAVKSAYRRRAFELHPDLNPGNAEAGRQFQLLNEAYVALSAMLKPAEEARRKAEAQKSATDSQKAESQKEESERKTEADRKTAEEARRKYEEEAKKEAPGGAPGGGTSTRDASRASEASEEREEVLRDLLNDPFARRVFEDIYSELSRKRDNGPDDAPKEETWRKPEPSENPRAPTGRRKIPAPPARSQTGGLWSKGKDWATRQLRKQLDEEQTLILPAARLAPGRKIRLQIRNGLSDDVNSVEVTLPPDFVVGKPVRLRGLGKRIGSWQGDLYLTINTE